MMQKNQNIRGIINLNQEEISLIHGGFHYTIQIANLCMEYGDAASYLHHIVAGMLCGTLGLVIDCGCCFYEYMNRYYAKYYVT